MSDKHYVHSDDRTALEQQLSKLGPWLEANATFLIYGLAAVLAVTAAVVYLRRQPPENADASAQLMLARQPEDFQEIADSAENTPLGNWARLNQANSLLNSGINNLFIDRETANDELDQAEAAFERLSGTSGELHERVLVGKAKLVEARCDGSEASVKAATDAWQHVLDEYPESIFIKFVEDRIARLKDPATRDFYARFAKYEPKPADDLLTPGLPGSDVPGIPDSADESEMPDPITLPDFSDAGEDPAIDEDSAADKDSSDEADPTDQTDQTDPTDPTDLSEEPAVEPAETEPTDTEPTDTEPAAEDPADEPDAPKRDIDPGA